jgi:ABC-type nitrate/sulfonate/bicarbonate transport system substrate-binding protein
MSRSGSSPRRGSSIREPSDLAGKTVGINALQGVAEVALKASLERDGVDPESVELLIDRPQLQELADHTREYGAVGEQVDVDEMIWKGAER